MRSPVISTGEVPPVQLTVMVPSVLPQVASVELIIGAISGESPIIIEAVSVHPLSSVTVTLYVPVGRLEKTCGELTFVPVRSPVIL